MKKEGEGTKDEGRKEGTKKDEWWAGMAADDVEACWRKEVGTEMS